MVADDSFNVQVDSPSGRKQYSKNSVSSDEYTFTAKADGKYVYCFGNEAWSSNSKEVSFNVHGVVYVPSDELPDDPLEREGKPHPVYQTERSVLIIRLAVRKLSEELAKVKDEQSYIVIRERVHRNTAESTNGRVKWWSMFQLGVLFAQGAFQVWWLKRFFEVRS